MSDLADKMKVRLMMDDDKNKVIEDLISIADTASIKMKACNIAEVIQEQENYSGDILIKIKRNEAVKTGKIAMEWKPLKEESNEGWLGVDLDGTLAHYDTWKGEEHIGEPIPEMAKRVKDWIKAGLRVKIFTARASVPTYIPFVKQWLKKHSFGDLEVTNTKDFNMWELFDDRCVAVEKNTGKLLSPSFIKANLRGGIEAKS